MSEAKNLRVEEAALRAGFTWGFFFGSMGGFVLGALVAWLWWHYV